MKKKVKAVILGLAVVSITSCLLLVVAALVLGKIRVLPRGAIPVIMTIMGCVSVFLGSFCSALYLREKGILFGILNGLLFTVVLFMISFLVLQKSLMIASVGKAAAILLSGSIGGILGVNRKSRVKF